MVKSSRYIVGKRKRSSFEKWRTLEMIEADLQLVMRTCLGARINEIVKSDKRVSKYN